MKRLDKMEIAWAAGLFEGEGCIHLAVHCPVLQLNMTDEDVVRKFHTVVSCGTVSGPYGPRVGDRKTKPYWAWRVSGSEYPQTLIAAFWPHLGIRRRNKAIEVLSIARKAPLSLALINRNKTHCKAGHPLIWLYNGKRRGCSICINTRRRKQGGRGEYKLRGVQHNET